MFYHYEPMNAKGLSALVNGWLEKYHFFGMIAATS
jgi:hypothetical protein